MRPKIWDAPLFGLPHQGALYNLDLAGMFLDELKLIPSYSTTDVEMEYALQLIEQRKVDVKKFVTATFPLSRVDEAFVADWGPNSDESPGNQLERSSNSSAPFQSMYPDTFSNAD